MNRRDVLAAVGLAAAAPLLTPRPVWAAAAAEQLKVRDLYVRGRQLTERAEALAGREVEMVGYMAPPLKPEINFFVLTKLPMSTCPFCETEAQWPDDIVLAFTEKLVEPVRYTDLIRTTGVFEIGFETDPGTGFVSFIRLRGARYRKL